jgi:hypothetical protein
VWAIALAPLRRLLTTGLWRLLIIWRNAWHGARARALPCCLVQAAEQPQALSEEEEEEEEAAAARVLVPGLTIEINLDALRYFLLPLLPTAPRP